MRKFAIKQAIFFPLGAMLALMLVGFIVPGYSSISQQGSELGLLPGYPAVFESILASIAGVTIIVFGLGLIGHPAGRFTFTAGTSIIFGISMLSNGIFTMGSPLHGMYAIGFAVVLTPILFIEEGGVRSMIYDRLSKIIGIRGQTLQFTFAEACARSCLSPL